MPRSTRSVRHPLRLPDLQADPHNANRGTDRGRASLAQSLHDHGAGRAVLIDRHGRIIAGNKTVEQAQRLNIPLRVVHADGSHLIAVQRDDLDLATDPHAKALAIADNRVGERRWCADAGRPTRFKPSSPSPTDAVRDGSAKLGHPVQNVTREHGLTPLPR